ncbi:tyrosine-type recombinase/integrase [Falsirhodobacter sp. 1013]|uniref:tyrosine-type recombinase/integrase n=1 Tax=Falsirhodobacter sp. 1013 TaxID=3417566 RepID=UPI003EBD4340
MNALHAALADYLQLRRSLGYKLHDAGLQLPRFVDFLIEHDVDHITIPLALEWARSPTTAQPSEWARRLGYVRMFARHLSASDKRTEIPPAWLLPHRSTRAKPYLYSDEEVRRLLAAALAMPVARKTASLRPWMYHCLLGLLAVTGLRISEALDLRIEDVDLDSGLLTIRAGKLDRWRFVPIHSSTCAVIADYIERRARFFGRPVPTNLFLSNLGRPIDGSVVYRGFYALSQRVGLRPRRGGHGPRLHDLRHRFATQVLTRWYEEGRDPVRDMPVLSTYLGHVRVEDTYWYLSLSPELMTQAISRLERRWGDAI